MHSAGTKRLACSLVVIGWLTLARPGPAATLHVPADHLTITAALLAAGSGDTVLVSPGLYSPSASGETFPLLVNQNGLRLIGSGMGVSVLDAEQTAGVLAVAAVSGAGIHSFTVTGGGAAVAGGLRIDGGDCEVSDVLFLDNGALVTGSAIAIFNDAAPWIHHNVIWGSYDLDLQDVGDPHAVQFRNTSTGLIEHNVVGRGDSNGIHFGQSSSPLVRHNILFENGRPADPRRGRGICALTSAPRRVSFNLFYGNVISAILLGGVGDFSAAEANDLDPDDEIHDNIDGDPLFRDPDALNLHLQAGSPAIDAGDPGLPGDPDGTILDIGPFYFDQLLAAVPTTPMLLSALHSAPNPFNPQTEIRFQTESALAARVEVLDLRGQLVRTLFSGTTAIGDNRISWDGRDAGGRAVASGVYLAAVTVGRELRTTPLVLVR
jgi:hypothetical protein